MANIKMTSSNFDDILQDMADNIGDSRTNNYYFSPSELNENSIRQLAWEKNILLTINSIDSFIQKVIYLDKLN